tara:strand:+ start:818 stop:1468 length:651 start_codon:yes stop_codon:yes gene_type:complete
VNIIIFGAPGAGKGTQADNLSNEYNLYKISTGDLLRKEIEKNTPLGKKIKSTVDKGSFVSDDLINNLIEKILKDEKLNSRLIFDGYPRNINQAEKLDILFRNHKQKISYVFSLTVSKEIIIKRILGRQICSKCGSIFNEYFRPSNSKNHQCGDKFILKRSDDNKETITNRFETYVKKTLPILNFYKKLNLLHEINGMGEIDQIYKEIRGVITSLET